MAILFLIFLIPSISGEGLPADDWNAYNDTVAGFSIRYPEEYNLFFSAAGDNRTISVTDQNNVTIYRVQARKTNGSFSQLRAFQEKKIRESVRDSNLTISTGSLGGLQAVHLEYEQQEPGMMEHNLIRESFAIHNTTEFSVRFVGNISAFEENSDLTTAIEDSFSIIPSEKPEKWQGDEYQNSWNYPGIIYDQFGIPYTIGYGGWYPVYIDPQIPQLYDQGGYYSPGFSDTGGYDGETGTPYQDGTPTPYPTVPPSPSYTLCDTGSPSPEPTQTPVSTIDGSGSRALVVIAPRDYNEEELDGVTSALEESGILFDIVSTTTGSASGMSGGKTTVSLTTDTVNNDGIEQYKGIILIGGEGAMTSLYDDIALRELVQAFDREEKIIGAICASPVVLSRAGLLSGKTVTLFGDPQGIEEVQAAGGIVRENEAVITDGRIITGNGPYAAREFGETVAGALLK